MKLEFASITVSYFIHSSEDAQRLNDSVCHSLGILSEELSIQTLEGHYGNELLSVKAHILGKRAQQVATTISNRLSPNAKSHLKFEIEKLVDEHDALYLRIDRLSLANALNLGDDEPIRVKFKPRFRTARDTMLESYLELIA